jgi:multidrug efflux pump subunit AcrA (membrane-fusion protein)
MIKIAILVFGVVSLFANEIPIKKVQMHHFQKEITLNAKVVQLSNAKQAVMAQVSGHIENYFVKPNQQIKKGDKIALLRSTTLSELTAKYLSVKKQYHQLSMTYHNNQTLYKKGLISAQELSQFSIQKDAMHATLLSLESKLQTLGIDTDNLRQASSDYILYAHSAGRVSKLLQPLHAVVDKEEQIISIIQEQAFYIESYLPLKYIRQVKIGDKIIVKSAGELIETKVSQILPKVDEVSQRAIILSKVEQKTDALFIGSYVTSLLYSGEQKALASVATSALSFFNNEWVVFVPKEEHHDNHEEHAEEKHEDDNHAEHHEDEEENHDEHHKHDKHDEHEDQEVPYEARVVEIIQKDAHFVAIKGLSVGESYVSDKSYFVKSMLLKSSLGGHGH